MKLSDLLQKDLVFLRIQLDTKDDIFQYIANVFAKKGIVKEGQQIFESLTEREKLMSTGIGDGLAIPHANLNGLGNIFVSIFLLEKPIEFQSIDENPVDIVIVVLADSKSTGQHLKILARIARLHKTGKFMQMIRDCRTEDDLIKKIQLLESSM